MDWQKLADKLDKKIYLMLLFTVAVIPLRQEFTAFCVSMTFLAALFVAVVQKKQAPQVLRPWQQGALWVLVAISIISIYFSRDRFISSWNWLYVVGQYCALFFVLLRYGWREQESCQAALREQGSLWQRFQSLPRPLQLVGAFLAVSVFVSALGILQKVLGIAGEGIWSDPDQFPDLKVRVYSTLVNPNILAGYLVLVIAYATAFFNVAKSRLKLRLIFLGIGILAALCLLYTYSRGNWLACAAVLLAFCILFCHKAFVPVLAGGAAALAVGGAAVMQRLASITSGEDTSAALRIAYMESTVAVIEDFPWGVGWCGYRFVYPDYNFYLDDTSVIMYHCHNIFLNVFAELGVQGILAFLLVWWGIFLPAGWRLAYAGRTLWLKAMGRGYVLATVGIAIGGLTDHVYFNTQMGLLFWLLGGLTMLCAKINSDRNM
ncbi:O-antigen ligase family protein [Phascolarctobacterium sp.]|uniref:O-antigen ligase family protein n=1 Tax=Phascolarctobacterium sp. TaxID=2049039 RepID=UPI00386DB371